MFRSIITLMFFSFALVGHASDSHHMKQNGKKMEVAESSRKKVGKQVRTALIGIFKANEDLHQAFFQYDGKEVESKANNVLKAIGKVTDPDIGKLFKFSKTKLTEMTASKNRKENNESYSMVSAALAHVLSKYDLGSEYNTYYCPMVRKKWVQNSKKNPGVQNPYAPEMPNCGRKESNF